MLNLSKAVIYTLIVMTGFLQDMSIGQQSIMQKVQSSAVTQTIQPISAEEAKIIASSIIEEITVAKTIKPEVVIASYFGGEDGVGKDLHGQKMSNGEVFDKNDTKPAAHLKLPMETKVTLVSPTTKKAVVVTIKTKGPYVPDRQFDVSEAAAEKLGIIEKGVAPLYVTKIELPAGAKISLEDAYRML